MKALVLCAGLGTRLGDLTRLTPKPLLPLQGRPLLWYTLRYLASQGITAVAINLHYQADMIRRVVGDGSAFGLDIHFSYEPTLTGTAGAVRELRSYFDDVQDFLVLYGDLLIAQDLRAMWQFHQQQQAAATLLLHHRAESNSIVAMEADGRISAFLERPDPVARAAASGSWVNSGTYLINRDLVDRIPPAGAADFPRDVFGPFAAEERFFGFPLTGYRCAIDSPERYRQADEAVRSGAYPMPT